jgi:hypothetical protein
LYDGFFNNKVDFLGSLHLLIYLMKLQELKFQLTATNSLNVFPQTSLEGLSSLSLRDIRSSLSELNSCFAILFPGVTIPDIEAFPLKQLPVNDSTDMVSKDRISSLSRNSDRVVWEHDGEEIEAPLDYDSLGMFIKHLYQYVLQNFLKYTVLIQPFG